MVADVSIVGERGQITIPKIIRDNAGIESKDSMLIKYENGKITLEKFEEDNKKELLKEYYQKFAKRDKEIAKSFEVTLDDIKW
jgi:AbrB family looped-hinge helix DNA binding protein